MIRSPLPSDQGYIASTWLRSMLSGHAMRRHGDRSSARRMLPSEREIREETGKRIDAVLDRTDTRALVSVPDDDRNHILGWVLYVEGPSVPMIHYCYVRSEARGVGLARGLLERIGVARDRAVVCTSNGPASESMRNHFRASVHVPLAEFLR